MRPWIDRNDACAVRLGIAPDETFGPVIVVGRGGLIGQLLPDQAVALPPLNLNLARQVMAETDVSRLLQGLTGAAGGSSTRSPWLSSSCRKWPPTSPRSTPSRSTRCSPTSTASLR